MLGKVLQLFILLGYSQLRELFITFASWLQISLWSVVRYHHKCDYDIKETHLRPKKVLSFDIATLTWDIITPPLDCIVVHLKVFKSVSCFNCKIVQVNFWKTFSLKNGHMLITISVKIKPPTEKKYQKQSKHEPLKKKEVRSVAMEE